MADDTLIRVVALVAASTLAVASIGCAEGGSLDEPTQNEQDSQQNDDPDNHDDPDNQNQDDRSDSQTEIHQWCAAAGESSDGDVSSLHCSAPHNVSGFEAGDGEHRWQPGAFHVVAE